MANPRDVEELAELRELRSLLSARIKTLESRMRETPGRKTGGLTVRTSDLKPFLQEWVEKGNSLIELARRAVISEKSLYDIMGGRTQMTTDYLADSILTALDCSPTVLEELRERAKLPEPPPTKYWEE